MNITKAKIWRIPKVGDYYRALVKVDSLPEGTIVIVANASNDRIEVDDGSSSGWYYTPQKFQAGFTHIPDGTAVLQTEIDAAVIDVAELEAAALAHASDLSKLSPHLEAAPAELTEKALTPIAVDITETRAQVASVRNTVAKLRLDMKKRQEGAAKLVALQKQRVEAIFKAQADALRAKLDGLTDMLKKAEEAIWTINLYLGKDEQIVQVKKGRPAPKDSKITIRQLVLYADEECAIAADKGGIDATSIAAFDEWIAEPENRRQVLPEAKGVVAFKPRRHKKDYGGDSPADAWTDAQLNQQNKKTYFLMANGENLYRICTDLEVGERLIPTENEHADLFFREEYDHKTSSYKKEPIFPGDKRYMAAMDAASELKKHYLRILLFLQGLLDRTAVFAPLPAPRLNLLNRAVYGERLVFVNDAEKLLGTGKPPFTDWIQGLNAKLNVGHRIMGIFNNYRYGLHEFRREHRGGNTRISPPGASYPDDLKLYTIEGRADRSWFFRYERDDTVHRQGWDRNFKRQQSGPAKRRASCRIEPADDFIFNFDAARVEDMEFYLGNRTNRKDYEHMFPILRRAIQIKREEHAAEEPFRDLLAREIVKAYEVKLDEAAAAVEELVEWWKLKNMTHRALLSDDAKALRMIITEFGQRRRRGAARKRLGAQIAAIADHILRVEPHAVFIAHISAQTFITLIPHNAEDVYVREQEWQAQPDGTTILVKEKNWRTIQRKRILGWTAVHEGERWASWKLDAREADYLTGPERDELVAEIIPLAIKHVHESNKFDRDGKEKPKGPYDLVCVTRDKDKFHFWCWTQRSSIPQMLLSGKWRDPEMERVTITWSKKKGLIEPHFEGGTSTYEARHADTSRPFWHDEEVLQIDMVALGNYNQDIDTYEEARAVHKKLEFIEDAITNQAHKVMKEAKLAELRAKFIAEYEHEELWKDHKKSLREHELSAPYPRRIRSAAQHVIEREYARIWTVPKLEAFAGLPYSSLLKTAADLGWKWDPEPKEKSWHTRDIPDTADDENALLGVDKPIVFEDWQIEQEEKREGDIMSEPDEQHDTDFEDEDDEDNADDVDEDVK